MSDTQGLLERRIQVAGLIGGIIVFAALVAIPSLGALTAMQQSMAAAGALMTIWWLTEAIPIPATSLLPLVLFPLLGISSIQEAATPYANHLIYLFLGGFMIALGIERAGLHKRIALHVIRIVGTSPSRLVLGFMTATAFLSMWISNTATALMMLPIGLSVIRQVISLMPEEPGGEAVLNRRIGMPLLLGIAYASSIGGIGTLIGTPPNIVFAGVYENMYGHHAQIGFFQWMLFAVPLIVVFLPVAWWYLSRIAADVPLTTIRIEGGKEYIAGQIRELGKATSGERRMAAVFFITACAWIFRAPMNVELFVIPGLTEIIPGLQDSTIAMLAGLSLFILPEGTTARKTLIDWETVQKGVPWGILLLFGGGFALADGFELSGLTLMLGNTIASLHGVPPIILIAAVCLLLTFLTELTSNTATAAVLVPVVASAAVALGENPLILMIPATVSASCAFMLPVATPPNAIVYSAGCMTIRDMAKAGLFLNFAGVVIVTLLMYTLGLAVFDITLGVVPQGMVAPPAP